MTKIAKYVLGRGVWITSNTLQISSTRNSGGGYKSRAFDISPFALA